MSKGNNSNGSNWVLPNKKPARTQPVPASSPPLDIHKRKELFGLVDNKQDKEFENDMYGNYQDVTKGKQISVGMAHLTEFTNNVNQATAQKMQRDGEVYDPATLAGQLAERQVPETTEELESYNKQLRQAVGDNMLRRTQTER